VFAQPATLAVAAAFSEYTPMEYVVCTIRLQDWKEGVSQSLQTSRVRQKCDCCCAVAAAEAAATINSCSFHDHDFLQKNPNQSVTQLFELRRRPQAI
jgi:hypothetical protein